MKIVMQRSSAMFYPYFMKGWALITGASKGIGAEIAKGLAKRGYHLLLTARDEGALKQLAEQVQKDFGVSTLTFKADLTETSGVEKLKSFVDSLKDPFEILVNNAGFGFLGDFYQQDNPSIHQMMNLNMIAVTDLSHYFFQHFQKNKKGFILNVASTAAFQPIPYFGLYSATKSFILSLSQALYVEGKAQGIGVTVLCPGPVKTDFHERAGTSKSTFINRFMLPASNAAEAGIKGLFSNTPIVIPGFTNKLLVFSLRFFPRKTITVISGNLIH